VAMKYKSRPTVIHEASSGLTIRFDSLLEFNTYTLIKKWLKERNKEDFFISRQDRLEIAPPSEHYKASTWRADFTIRTSLGEIVAIVEAKGFPTQKFKSDLKLLDLFCPLLLDKLIIVGYKEAPIDKSFKIIEIRKLLDALDSLIIRKQKGQSFR